MHGLNFNHLFYFHAVATEGSQAAAARALRVRQSTISEQIRQLEDTLGERLFDRSSSGLSLTDAGRRALEFTEPMFTTAERLLEAFGKSSTPRTVVEIGITSSVSRSFAADFLLPLFDDPDLMPRIRHGSAAQLMQRLASQEVDIVLSDGKPAGVEEQNITTELAMELQLLLVGQRPAKENPGDPLPFVHYTSGSPWRFKVDECLRAAGSSIDVVGESDDLSVLRMAALKGRGAVALPRRVVGSDLDDLRLEVLADLDCALPVYLNYAEATVEEAVRRTVDRLLASARGTRLA